jgi:RNA polymerase sigma factor (sigma-70 family)
MDSLTPPPSSETGVMRNRQLDNVLRHLRGVAAARHTRELLDRELLERFVARRDEAAFAAIVQRHGPLVLGACRRILGSEHHAEDACQATFLVLARKAASIRRRESLGSWLYGVASRVARKVRADVRRRASRDVTPADVPRPDTTAEITWREGLAVLDEELSRLPASYRSALVLCYLEGRTQDEAARELGCSPGALRGRLERARECLRGRLVRRGVGLPAALLAAVLVSTRAAAALPPALAAGTVKAALRLLAGQALTRVVTAPVATLTEGVLRAMFVTRVKKVLAVLLMVGLLAAGALAAAAGGAREAPGPDEAKSPALPAADDKAAQDEQTVRCVVRDKAGKPIAGARVYWTNTTTVAPVTSVKALPRAQWGLVKKVIAEGKTDAEGRCDLRGRLTGPESPDLMALAAVAPCYGLNGKLRLDPAGKDPLTITLRPEMKIKGQLLTPAGAPAQGVRVRLKRIDFGGGGGGGVAVDFSDSWKVKESDLPYWPATAVTDAQGRFTLGGLSEDADAALSLIHEDFELQEVLVSAKAKGSDAKRLKPEFTHTLAPGRTVRGVVTAADTGKPLPGVFLDIQAGRLNAFYGEARTDEQGRYRMPGPAGLSDYQVGAYPPPDSGYLAVRGDRGGQWPAGATSIEVNLKLPRGRLLRGTVLDADTKKPLAGVGIVYDAHRDNRHFWDQPSPDLFNPALTDHEGRFTITGLPGQGLLLAEGPSLDYVRTMLPWREGPLRGDLYPHGHAKVNVPEKGEPAAVEITLRKGVTLEARVLRPDGTPVPRVMAYCRGMGPLSVHSFRWDYGVPFEKGLFRMQGCDPDRTYRVFFLQPELHLGAVVELKPGAKPAEVRLEPTASARGKLAQPDGSPAKGGWAAARLATVKDDGKLDPKSFDWQDGTLGLDMLIHGFGAPPKANDGDSFLVENLIPGAPLYIEAGAGRLIVRRPVVLKPGEVKDLGTLQLPKAGEKP